MPIAGPLFTDDKHKNWMGISSIFENLRLIILWSLLYCVVSSYSIGNSFSQNSDTAYLGIAFFSIEDITFKAVLSIIAQIVMLFCLKHFFSNFFESKIEKIQPKLELDEKSFTVLVVGLSWMLDHDMIRNYMELMIENQPLKIVKIISKKGAI